MGPLSGAQRAAIFLLSLTEEAAAAVFKHFENDEIKAIMVAMEELGNVQAADLEGVFSTFGEVVKGEPILLEGGASYLRGALDKGIGIDRARRILGEVKEEAPPTLERLANVHPKALANVLEVEHPQTVSLVLINLVPSHAAEVLLRLPPEMQEDVVSRIAKLERVSPKVVREIESLLVSEIVGLDVSDDQEVGGKAQAAALLNNMDREIGIDILQRLEKTDNALATDIRQSMFVFEDLMGVDNRGMQAVLKEISGDSLVLALKTASEELKSKIFGNMSSRAADMMREDLEAMGPVKLSDVEEAQKAIATIALRLQEEGTIVVAGAGGDVV